MVLPLKKTQTLTGSKRSTMLFTITRIKPKYQDSKCLNYLRRVYCSNSVRTILLVMMTFMMASPVFAVSDPTTTSNNKVGVHIISPTSQEAEEASKLVNANGDWGYVTFVIESQDKNRAKWQEFFDELRRKHLIPLVRIATEPEGDHWKRPSDDDINSWAEFLNSLYWPTKNRYVIVYNEPNHAAEWGGSVDARNYAHVLDKTITALKAKNQDFFVINAGFDASAPHKLPNYQDELDYMQQMNDEVPGIFNRLDGWSSHSYPNPGFAGSPNDTGRGTVRTWLWELQVLRSLGVERTLPVFITEAGWKHAEGLDYDRSLPTAETVKAYLKDAFANAWNSDQIVAVTPFLLDYQQPPFDHFSFKKTPENAKNDQVLGANTDPYYVHYDALEELPKIKGRPLQDYKAQLTKGALYPTIVADENYEITLTIKNTGQATWNEYDRVYLVATQGTQELGIHPVPLPVDKKVEPGQEYEFTVRVHAPEGGKFPVTLNLFAGSSQFISEPFQFTSEVKAPVSLQIKAALGWKNNPAGEFILDVAGTVKKSIKIMIEQSGSSGSTEDKSLPADQEYDFTLNKPFYKSKTIHHTVRPGLNILDFGELQPNISSALFHPIEFWKLLPLSN